MEQLSLYEDTIEKLKFLKLDAIVKHLSEAIDDNNMGEKTFLEELHFLVSKQVDMRKENIYNSCVKVSHFPFIKTIDDFDFSFQSSVSKPVIKDLCSLRFLQENKNIIFIGSPGTGKTHLATSIGLEAAKNSKLTYFITCNDLIWQLDKARRENTLERRLKHFYSYSLLIIDELGHDILTQEQSNELFQGSYNYFV